ncbi:hypothetical protein MASR2M78_21150 [Treponema sp.]
MPSINNQSDFEFDSRGRLFISDGSEINRYTAFSGSVTPDLTLSASNVALAYDAPRNRLYASHKSTGNLTYFDLNQDTPGQVYVNDPVGYTFTEGGVAVDSSGNVFIVADNGSGTKGILKISIGTAPGEPLEAQGPFLPLHQKAPSV